MRTENFRVSADRIHPNLESPFHFSGFSSPELPSKGAWSQPSDPSTRLITSIQHHFQADCFRSALKFERNPIKDIVFGLNVVCALTENGLASCYSISDECFLCNLNSGPEEIVRSVFHVPSNGEFIKVVTRTGANEAALKSYSYTEDEIIFGSLPSKKPIFSKELLIYPGFIEVDRMNCHAITFDGAKGSFFHIWSLETHQLLYSTKAKQAIDIKVGPGMMALIGKPLNAELPLRFVRASDGYEAETFHFRLRSSSPIEFVEHCSEVIMVKQQNTDLTIYDRCSSVYKVIEDTSECIPCYFSFLYPTKRIVVFKNGGFECYTFGGTLKGEFEREKHLSPSIVSVPLSHRWFFVVSEDEGCKQRLSVFHIESGTVIVNHEIDNSMNWRRKIVAMAFSETNNCLFYGDEGGFIHFWK